MAVLTIVVQLVLVAGVGTIGALVLRHHLAERAKLARYERALRVRLEREGRR